MSTAIINAIFDSFARFFFDLFKGGKKGKDKKKKKPRKGIKKKKKK